MASSSASSVKEYRLSVTSFSFTPESDDDPDGPHINEYWRLEFFPRGGHGLPREDAIFVKCERNYDVPDALENRILSAPEVTRHDMITNFAESVFREKGWHNFEILNSIPVAMPPVKIDLSFDSQIIPYTSLEPSLTKLPHEVHRPVTFTGKVYLMKTAALPGDEFHLLQELSHYKKLSGSRWLPELGGIVNRQGRQEAFLVRYYPAGDLRRHFDADEHTKRSWVVQLAQALAEFNATGFYHRDIKCANIVVDDENNIRIIDLENTGTTEGWSHPDDANAFFIPFDMKDCSIPGDFESAFPPQDYESLVSPFIPPSESEPPSYAIPPSYAPPTITKSQSQKFQVYGFGKTVWEFYVGKRPTNENDLLETPAWVQSLVRRCCKEDTFESMDDVIGFLLNRSSQEIRSK